MANGQNWLDKAPKVLKELQSTTQLLGLVVLVAAIALIGAGISTSGNIQYLCVGGGLALLLMVVLGALYLESKRIAGHTGMPATGLAEVEPPARYDVFLSTPMAAHTDDAARQQHHDQIVKVKDALRVHCKVDRTFYAGTDIVDEKTFESEDLSLRSNFDALTKSRNFVLIYPKRLASSMLVEAGMALASRKNSVWFVKKGEQLPFLLRGGANASGKDGLPNIRLYEYESIDDIVTRLKNNGPELFKPS